jgi:hypothetical protein
MSKSCVEPSRKMFSQEILVDLVEKTKEKYVLLKLKQCYSTTISFDLWMSKDNIKKNFVKS